MSTATRETLSTHQVLNFNSNWTDADRAEIGNLMADHADRVVEYATIPSRSYVRGYDADGNWIIEIAAGWVDVPNPSGPRKDGRRTVFQTSRSAARAARETRQVQVTVEVCTRCFTQVSTSGTCLCY